MARTVFARRLAARFTFAFAAAIPALSSCVSGEAPAEPVAPCDAYCDEVTTNCPGELAPYASREQCANACALMPRGAEVDGANTVGCRLAHARIGKSKEECRKASAFGGGACGEKCVVFCSLVAGNCIAPPISAAAKPYDSEATCVERCNDTLSTHFEAGTIEGANATGDTLNCRMYHLLLSLGAQEGHCPHTAVASTQCK